MNYYVMLKVVEMISNELLDYSREKYMEATNEAEEQLNDKRITALSKIIDLVQESWDDFKKERR